MYKDEIVISDLLNFLWKEKFKIFLIALVLVLVISFINFVSSLSNSVKKNYEYIVNINVSDKYKYSKLIHINSFISKLKHQNKNQKNHLKFDTLEEPSLEVPFLNISLITSASVFERFKKELSDQEEIFIALNNNPYVKKKISKLSNLEKKIALQKYAESFKLDLKSYGGQIFFKWHDYDQANKILNDTLTLVIFNMKRSIIEEYKEYLNLSKDWFIRKDLLRISYLLEQNILAKELNILKFNSKNLNNINFYNKDNYHLRGSKVIEKEIKIIENRDYSEITFLLENLNFLEDTDGFNFIRYNIEPAAVIESDSSKYIINFILSLVIAIIFVIIKKELKFR